ncbi:MAG: MerR family transcriptional regulator [Solirubrobacterales bacterium]
MADAAAEMTIDELARASGMTARNIRAHQSRGLLPAPTVRARTGYYGPEHLARIRLIQDMQAEGFNLKSIERLLDMGAGGGREALEFQRALLEPFGSEEPEVVDADGLEQVFGDPPDRKLIAKAEKIGLLTPIGDQTWEVPSPTLLRAGRDLIELGIPLEHALAVGDSINKHTTAIATEFVRLFVKDVLTPIRKSGGAEDLGAAGEAVERLRPLASQAVMASFGVVMTRAVERQIERELG